MDEKTKNNYLRLMEAARGDERYRCLLAEYEALSAEVVAVMESLTPEQREPIADYLGLIGAVDLYLVQLACEGMEFPEQE